ncbi:hypothetical protein [Azohydromonas caseinilytica]|nr:hypothetical protein [Azohydromonas caseinilytica]
MTKAQSTDIRVALFGQSGAGKTTFLVSYFGNQQRHSFEQKHGYRLEADDVAVGNQLLSRYYKMECGQFPDGTSVSSEYKFNLKLAGLSEPGLHITWVDYPGAWWESQPKDSAEKTSRQNALSGLLGCHVGLLLVDGMQYRRHGLSYVRALLDQFKSEIRRLKDAASKVTQRENFPQIWLLAISKADVLSPGTTAEMIGKEITMGAADQIKGVADALDSKQFGHQYLLLSSAEADGSKVLDATKCIGFQLLAPIALESMLLDAVAEARKKENGRSGLFAKVLDTLSSIVDMVDSLDDFLPPKYQVFTKLLKAMSIKEELNKGASHFREKQAAASKRGDIIAATASAMKAELSSPMARKAYFNNQA